MFGLFRKKVIQSLESPRLLYFKSNAAAFSYACKYSNNSLKDEGKVLGVVLGGFRGDYAAVKLANPDDPSIPPGELKCEDFEEMIDRGNTKNVCLTAEKLERVPSLKVGDLIMFIMPKEIYDILEGQRECADILYTGFIVAKVEPICSVELGGWRIAKY